MHRDIIVEKNLAPLFRFAWALSGEDATAIKLVKQVFANDSWNRTQATDAQGIQLSLFTAAYRCFTGAEPLPIPPTHDRVAALSQESLNYANSLTSDSLLRSFRELELPQRAALVLFYTTEHSIHAIAAVLHRSKGETVKIIARGKAEWLHILQREGETKAGNLGGRKL